MFYEIWKYHAIAAPRLITSQEELDSLNEEWRESPQAAALFAQQRDAQPPSDEAIEAARKAEEDALKDKIAAEDVELARMIAEDEATKAKQANLVTEAIAVGVANAAERARENQEDPRKADQS